jgi:pimeloyl-ACP methyl ester carboxylesterase
MYFLYKDHKMSYDVSGQGSYLVLMHGWGVDQSTYATIKERLQLYFTVVTFDFLGFGKSDEPHIPFTLNDYVDGVKALLSFLNITNPILLGHSFGGRVAIKYAQKNDVKSLILVDSAGVKKFSLKIWLKIIKYKCLKRFYNLFSKTKLEKLINSTGSPDYQKSSSIMKRTMSNVIKENLKKNIKRINCNTLILWGYYDRATPFSDAIYINKNIKDSRLITFYHSGHFPYIDEANKFISVVISGGIKDDIRNY